MLRYLADWANAITACGLLFSASALYLAVAGQPEAAVAAVLWAMLADHLDGVVAKRLRNRPADAAAMGKSLDGFADIIYGAVVPVAIIVSLSDGAWWSLPAAMAMLLAGALRLSYFANFGLSTDGRFTGVPLSYDAPVLAILFIARPWLPADGFVPLVNLAGLALAALHVSSLKVPAMRGAGYAAITAFSVASSSLLALRAIA